MKRKATYYVIPRDQIESMAVADALDMLRYDGATVVSNAPDGFYLFRIDGMKEPEVRRWKSFGVTEVRSFDPVLWQIDDLPFLKELFR